MGTLYNNLQPLLKPKVRNGLMRPLNPKKCSYVLICQSYNEREQVASISAFFMIDEKNGEHTIKNFRMHHVSQSLEILESMVSFLKQESQCSKITYQVADEDDVINCYDELERIGFVPTFQEGPGATSVLTLDVSHHVSTRTV